jgi:predicted anti-sigma-YlaC factor YlaD
MSQPQHSRLAPAPELPTRPRPQVLVIGATLLCGTSMLALGVWASAWPEAFARFIDFAPYNRHLIHDAGAFQIGIGVSMLLASIWPDGLSVALAGFVVASGLHSVSHFTDRHIGGHDSDVPALGLLTLVGMVALCLRMRER